MTDERVVDSDNDHAMGWDGKLPANPAVEQGLGSFESGEIQDSAHVKLNKPLYDHVRDHIGT